MERRGAAHACLERRLDDSQPARGVGVCCDDDFMPKVLDVRFCLEPVQVIDQRITHLVPGSDRMLLQYLHAKDAVRVRRNVEHERLPGLLLVLQVGDHAQPGLAERANLRCGKVI